MKTRIAIALFVTLSTIYVGMWIAYLVVRFINKGLERWSILN